MKTVLLDQHFMFLQAVQTMIRDDLELEISGVSGEGEKGITLIRISQPSTSLFRCESFRHVRNESVRWTKKHYPETKVILLTDKEDRHYVKEAIHLGVEGYLLKTMHLREFVKAVEWIKAGQVYYYAPVLIPVVPELYRSLIPKRMIVFH